MAALVGAVGAIVAFALQWLIGLITNLAYFGRFGTHLTSPAGTTLGVYSVLVPVVGRLIIGLMARYGLEKIRGHGIPEAMEAILIGGIIARKDLLRMRTGVVSQALGRGSTPRFLHRSAGTR